MSLIDAKRKMDERREDEIKQLRKDFANAKSGIQGNPDVIAAIEALEKRVEKLEETTGVKPE